MLRVAEMLMFVWLVGWFGYRAQNAGKSVVIGLLVGALAATITKISSVLAVDQWGEGLEYTTVWLRLMVRARQTITFTEWPPRGILR